jgi:hypothetical protein
VEATTVARKQTSLDALRHPVRVRIIEACVEWGTLSPVEILNRRLCADVESVRGKTPKQALSHISYHCRRLEEAELLTLVSTRPVRGATEHFYRANEEAVFSDEEWSALGVTERAEISRVVWQRFIAQVESAMHRGTFDSREERTMAWGPLDLDGEGWEELAARAQDWYGEVEQIKRAAESRLEDSGEPSIRSTYGIFTFVSPARRLDG